MAEIIVKAGKLFCISTGEYSDYQYQGHFLALQDISNELIAEIVAECKAEEKAKKEADKSCYGHAQDVFLPKLIQRGLILDIDCQEIHIGSYSELEIS